MMQHITITKGNHGRDQVSCGADPNHREISTISVCSRCCCDSIFASSRRQFSPWPNLLQLGQACRLHHAVAFSGFQREVLHQIMAHDWVLDRLCLPCLLADPVAYAFSDHSCNGSHSAE